MRKNLPYYLDNDAAKDWFGVKAWRERLEDHGYVLQQNGDDFSIEKLPDSPRHRAFYGARKLLRRIKKTPRVLAARLRPKSRLRALWKSVARKKS